MTIHSAPFGNKQTPQQLLAELMHEPGMREIVIVIRYEDGTSRAAYSDADLLAIVGLLELGKRTLFNSCME